MRRTAIMLAAVATLSRLCCGDSEIPPSRKPEIYLAGTNDDLKQLSIRVVRLPDEVLSALANTHDRDGRLPKVLELFTADAGTTPVLGRLEVLDDTLGFVPRFPLKPGLEYRAVFDPSPLALRDARIGRLETRLAVPLLPLLPPAVVQTVYPSSDQLPENQLRFYVHFSAPMSRGDSYRHIRLLDEEGQTVFRPFLELGEELWDPSGRRFTLLVDPGRIKRGLKPRAEFGPVFENGKSYTLHIDSAWQDATGRPLVDSFRKRFVIGPPDEVQPNPDDWEISPPAAESAEPLVVKFAEPLDHGMLLGVLNVINSAGEFVAGSVAVDQYETRWSLQPEIVWQQGHYELVIDTALEDRAGNNIRQPFEVSMDADDPDSNVRRTVRLGFDVR